MIKINAIDKVNNLIDSNNGYLTANMAKENEIDNKILQRMVKSELIERVAHGLYTKTDIFPDPFYIAQYRCPKGVFSHLTAMYLHGFSDRYPIKTTLTIPTGSDTKLLADNNYIFYYNSPRLMELGVVEIKSDSNMLVKAFDIERTLCDCLKHVNKMDKDLVLAGFKRYLQSNMRNNIKLIEYAGELKIEDTVRQYLEVL